MNVRQVDIREITVQELSTKLAQEGESVALIDVREEFEKAIADIGGKCISLAEIVSRAEEIPSEGEVVLYCRSGGRSAEAVRILQEQLGYTNLFNLQGGILAWADKIDPTLKKY